MSPTSRRADRGYFLVLEGGEGAGKSTQVRLLAQALSREGVDVLVTREPGATDLGAAIRGLLLSGPTPVPAAEALLYAADRAEHAARVIRPALDRGAVVISDRFVDSSVAYQSAGRGLDPSDVEKLSAWATGGLRPDLVVVLDIDPLVGLDRVAARGAADRMERESMEFHEAVRGMFLARAGADESRYVVLAADQPEAELAALILKAVRRHVSSIGG